MDSIDEKTIKRVANMDSLDGQRTLQADRQPILGKIDRYELLKELGGGGFGRVFLAKDSVAGIQVAVKGLPGEVAYVPDELERIRANFALVVQLHHPRIAALLHLHRAEKVWYASESVKKALRVLEEDYLLVMEYASGTTLSQWRKQFQGGRVPVDKALDVCGQVAEALDYAHERKIVHRDVKPANIMVETDENGRLTCRVLDFGLAAEIRSSMSRVSKDNTGGQSGTRPYMAPEQWRGQRADGRTDQYALAVMFYELVSGEVPFAGAFETNDPVIMMNVVKTELPEPLKELSDSQNTALLQALAKERKDRFEDCGQFMEAMRGKGLLKVSAVEIQAVKVPPQVVPPSSEHQPGELRNVDIGGGVEMEFAWIPSGKFLMGSPTSEKGRMEWEGPQHEVRFAQGFWMGTTPVTQAQYERVMGGNPSYFKGDSQPVEQVSWNDATHFCSALQKGLSGEWAGWKVRLPSEAEWEYACRAGTTTPFHYGDSLDATMANFDGNYPYGNGRKGEYRGKTTPVKSFKSNEWGLYDMHGNVWEWCEDKWHDNYAGAPTDGSAWLEGGSGNRVLRGGSWSSLAKICRSAFRNIDVPGYASSSDGFRVVLSR